MSWRSRTRAAMSAVGLRPGGASSGRSPRSGSGDHEVVRGPPPWAARSSARAAAERWRRQYRGGVLGRAQHPAQRDRLRPLLGVR